MKPSLGIGVILATLISLALFLFGVADYARLGALLLLLNGLWILVYGLVEAQSKERLYYAGWGLIMAGLSTFVVLPLAYTLGVTVVLVIVVVAARLIVGAGKPVM